MQECEKVRSELRNLLEDNGIRVFDCFMTALIKRLHKVYVDKLNEMRAENPEDFDRRMVGQFPPDYEDCVATAYVEGYEIGYLESKVKRIRCLISNNCLTEDLAKFVLGI